MDAAPERVWKIIGDCLHQALTRGLGRDGLLFPVECTSLPEGELKTFCLRLEQIFGMINESYRYAQSLASGDLNAEVSRNNVFAMPLKALHASLRHLTWQTNQVANGDLNQQVAFLGEFSQSFNRMIESLRDKEALEQRLKTITDTLGEGVYLVDPQGCLIFANPEAERLLGYSQKEMAGQTIFSTIHSREANGTLHPHETTQLATAIRLGQSYHNDDCVFTCQSGRLMPVSVACRPVRLGGRLEGSVIAFRDITAQKKYQESLHTINSLLEKQASTDALTGIYNRLKFGKLLGVELARARRYKSSLAVIMFDIDKFKGINDTYGHQSGDSVLRDIARVVGNNVRATEIFARWGGEEFMVVAPGCNLDQGLRFAEKLRQLVAKTSFAIPRPVTSSFGVAAFREGDSELGLTNRADQALYRAKENGRNRVEAEEPSPG